MNYETVTVAASADAWRSRVKTALIKAAIDITVDSPSGDLNTRRDRLAREILRDPDVWTARFAVPVALGFIADADLSDVAVTDPEMDTRIASIFNDFISA